MATGLVACAALLPSPASAAPAPGYSEFAACPNLPTIDQCISGKISAGSYKLGNITTPITKPLTLTGGITNDSIPGKLKFNAGGGLGGGPLKVPGGLLGLTGLGAAFLHLITLGNDEVYATPEIVGQAELTEDGGYRLPIRVKLKNAFLNSNCAIGSASKPIILNLTYGTTTPPPPNQPISGVSPDFAYDGATDIISSNNGTIVDNSFSVPKPSGCGSYLGPIYVGLLDDIVALRVGLPSAAGKNSAINADFDLKITGRTTVYPGS